MGFRRGLWRRSEILERIMENLVGSTRDAHDIRVGAYFVKLSEEVEGGLRLFIQCGNKW
jgi:hypothetical protein